jgi:hypothetical protein
MISAAGSPSYYEGGTCFLFAFLCSFARPLVPFCMSLPGLPFPCSFPPRPRCHQTPYLFSSLVRSCFSLTPRPSLKKRHIEK